MEGAEIAPIRGINIYVMWIDRWGRTYLHMEIRDMMVVRRVSLAESDLPPDALCIRLYAHEQFLALRDTALPFRLADALPRNISHPPENVDIVP